MSEEEQGTPPPGTPRPKAKPKKRPTPRQTAQKQVTEHLAGARVTEARKRLAVDRHTAAVQAAGGPVPLDWYTRQILAPTWGVAR